jgi:hypothetical protein
MGFPMILKFTCFFTGGDNDNQAVNMGTAKIAFFHLTVKAKKSSSLLQLKKIKRIVMSKK